ncbi:GMC oxidoreductase [Mycobacterium colombiense]|uniref:GMC oxidoreductase n=1 Tax=Mycobacterium colombiense TaxID=339268 RepID=UPI001BAF0044|nr:GMC oxidoreductase [Mycobacterium colombiense]
MDHVFFLSKEGWKRARERERYDYVVVGSGPCALAFIDRALHHDSRARILVIERGPYFLPAHFQNLPLPYRYTLGGLTETFPWTLSAATARQPAGRISWQHGIVPFFGGRSIMWSSWCPRPTSEEMVDWPPAVIDAARRNFDDAERLLNVVPADRIDDNLDESTMSIVAGQRPVYGVMQRKLGQMLQSKLNQVPTATRVMAAPIAVGAGIQEGLDFAKFSTPGPLLDLWSRQGRLALAGKGSPLDIVCECVVQRILQQGGCATALATSRGVVNLGSAKLILAMSALPPTTLLLNSFPKLRNVGARFTAHFITAITARIPRSHFEFDAQLASMELAAIYLAGVDPHSQKQYHVQLSVLADSEPEVNARRAARYMPDVVATASPQQLQTSKDYLVFVCAVLGELDHHNANNWMRKNHDDHDPTTNATLQVLANETDAATWDTMDQATFEMLKALSPNGAGAIQYWHGSAEAGDWNSTEPSVEERRVSGLVHEGSTLWIDSNPQNGVVGEDYRPHGVDNVYLTGSGLWPRSGSWNPTLTMVALAQDLADQLARPKSGNTNDAAT